MHEYINKIILIAFLTLLPSMAIANDKSKKNDTIAVDIVAGEIGDVKYRATVATIQKSIRKKRINKATEYPEGEPTEFHIIDIKGHKIFKHWNATSFTDPIFKMPGDLGTGVTIKEFRKIYGTGEITDKEGDALCFDSQTPKYHFCISVRNGDYKGDGEKVSEIWVW